MKIKRILITAISSLMILTACENTAGKNPASNSEKTDTSIVVSSRDDKEYQEMPDNSRTSERQESSESSEKEDKNESADNTDNSTTNDDPSSADIIEIPSCRAAMLYCVEDNEIIYDDYSDLKTAPASITKILAASVVLKYMDPEDVIEVGSELELVNEDSSTCFIAQGHRLTINDLLTGMLMCSGNDAAYTAAVNTARAVYPDLYLNDKEAVRAFVSLMNKTAEEIGMTNSHFTTPDGWDDDDQYITAADLAKLAKYALSVPEIRFIVAAHEKYVVFESGENITWVNTNLLIDPDSNYYSENAIGIKTGTTENAGYCLLSGFQKDGKTYIAAVLGCSDDPGRYELTLKIFDLV